MAEDIRLSLLEQVQIASPCSARWEDMNGDDVTRHCAQCDLDVHNLSAMSRNQAESFLRERLGSERVCAGFYRRSDGTVLTRDCPVGLAAVRARARRAVVRVAAAFVALCSATAFAQWRSGTHDDYPLSMRAEMKDFDVFARVRGWMRPIQWAQLTRGQMLFGDVSLPVLRTWRETLTNTDNGRPEFE